MTGRLLCFLSDNNLDDEVDIRDLTRLARHVAEIEPLESMIN